MQRGARSRLCCAQLCGRGCAGHAPCGRTGQLESIPTSDPTLSQPNTVRASSDIHTVSCVLSVSLCGGSRYGDIRLCKLASFRPHTHVRTRLNSVSHLSLSNVRGHSHTHCVTRGAYAHHPQILHWQARVTGGACACHRSSTGMRDKTRRSRPSANHRLSAARS